MGGPVLALDVHDDPVAQGSKIAGKSKSGAAFVRESNAHALHAWRALVRARACAELGRQGGGAPLPLVPEGPVSLRVTFTLRRPKSHWGTGRNAGQLKASAPKYHDHQPDADKLARAVLDALTGVAYRDDGQVAALSVVKLWGDHGGARLEVFARG